MSPERVRVKPGWGSFDGAVGDIVESFPADGYVLVKLDDEERPMRFDDGLIEIIED